MVKMFKKLIYLNQSKNTKD